MYVFYVGGQPKTMLMKPICILIIVVVLYVFMYVGYNLDECASNVARY